jgi:uncharacterized membrane protein
MPETRRTLLRDETFATIVAIGIVACQWWIMDELHVPAKWAVPAVATALMVAVIFVKLLPGRSTSLGRRLRVGLMVLLVIANFVNLLALGAQAFFDAPSGAMELLFTGTVLWFMNVLVFGLLYWVVDAGGPEVRAGAAPVARDFVFPQETDERNSPCGWRAMFGDYLYLAFTGAIAFGPTDAMPYSRRAKAAMAMEGALALAILGVIIARAVSLAGS